MKITRAGRAYYNENDPSAAAWLRELIKAGLIADGDVDERSIEDVLPSDLDGYTQCHFFAGIGGWSYALRLAQWPDDKVVWTGSCPCQPFSAAGKGRGIADERHLWPAFHWLVAQCGPSVVFGEQVASKAGRAWLAGVRTDLEALGYAVGAADLCAAGVGAPHIRQRLYWAADASSADRRPGAGGVNGSSARDGNRMGNSDRCRRNGSDAHVHAGQSRQTRLLSAWDGAGLIECADGKTRRIEPGIAPLAHGVPGRVGSLRGYGNAIVPQVAATFIQSFTLISDNRTTDPDDQEAGGHRRVLEQFPVRPVR